MANLIVASLVGLQSRWRERQIGKRRLSRPLLLAALAVAALVATPLAYLLLRAAAPAETWARLLQTRLLGLLTNTLALMAAVTLGTVVLGVALAWLVERTDLPGRPVWRWLLAVPLAMPAFIGAVVHVALLRPRGGIVPRFLAETLGVDWQGPSPFGFWGAAFMLTLFMYPYVYLLSAAAFRNLHASLEEAARSLGRNAWQTLWTVTLPVLRPGLAAGALLVALDVLAEYGTVALLRYETFSAAIFLQLSGRYDRSAAAILSGGLVVIALAVLAIELWLQGRARAEQVGGHWRPAPPQPLRAWRWPAFALVAAVSLATVFVPVTVLAAWTVQGLRDGPTLAELDRAAGRGLGHYLFNSLWSAGLAAGLAVALSVPVAYLAVRYPRWTSRGLSHLCQVGYALPGVVVALSLILLTNTALPALRGLPLVVVLAYVVRHMPQAVRSSQAALAQLAPSLEEAGRSLGRDSLNVLLTVTVPLIFPGLLAGAALVFLTSLKELPATLLLRPAGFDTLAVRVWLAANDGLYPQAAPAALLLTLCAAVPLAFLLRRGRI